MVVQMVEAEAVPCVASGFVGEVEFIDSGLESIEFGFNGDFGEGSLGADELLLPLPAAAVADKEDGEENDSEGGDGAGDYFDP